jgi:hypothetical protein
MNTFTVVMKNEDACNTLTRNSKFTKGHNSVKMDDTVMTLTKCLKDLFLVNYKLIVLLVDEI